MTIYIDNECKCHVSNPNGTYTEIVAPGQFNGKCAAYIEGFRVKPVGYTFTHEDGKVFGPNGYSVSPWRDLALLNEFQVQYETQFAETEQLRADLADADAALAEVGVIIDG